jgi:hypothetical protein
VVVIEGAIAQAVYKPFGAMTNDQHLLVKVPGRTWFTARLIGVFATPMAISSFWVAPTT